MSLLRGVKSCNSCPRPLPTSAKFYPALDLCFSHTTGAMLLQYASRSEGNYNYISLVRIFMQFGPRTSIMTCQPSKSLCHMNWSTISGRCLEYQVFCVKSHQSQQLLSSKDALQNQTYRENHKYCWRTGTQHTMCCSCVGQKCSCITHNSGVSGVNQFISGRCAFMRHFHNVLEWSGQTTHQRFNDQKHKDYIIIILAPPKGRVGVKHLDLSVCLSACTTQKLLLRLIILPHWEIGTNMTYKYVMTSNVSHNEKTA